jgi:hypothetical protein
LVISNIKTGHIIYEEMFSEVFVSMYKRDLNNDSHDELILTMTPGAISNHLLIITVTPKRAYLILDKSYRANHSVEFVNVLNKSDVFITDAELGTGPYYTTHYSWRGKSYQPEALVPYEFFSRYKKSLRQKKFAVQSRQGSSKATSNNSLNRTRNQQTSLHLR